MAVAAAATVATAVAAAATVATAVAAATVAKEWSPLAGHSGMLLAKRDLQM